MARILVACGGTGGHFYPGLSLGRALKEEGHEVLFLLRSGDPSFKTLESLHLPSIEAELSGLPRRLLAPWPAWAWRNLGGFGTVWNAVRTYKPDCVIGMGGYVSFPAAFFAWLRGIPVLVHESNAQLGLANRLARPFARTLALGLPIEGAGSNAAVTGTPVRPSLLDLPSKEEARRELGLKASLPTVLVFGGSQGARALNRLALGAARILAGRRPGGIQFLQLAGRADAEETEREGRGLPVKVLAYLEGMDRAYAAADLVVSRSGASTAAELIATRRPAVLIPFPYATGKHQDANARVLERAGGAHVLLEEAATPEGLAKEVERAILEEGRKGLPEYRGLPDPRRAVERLSACVKDLLLGEEE